jgi:hypothetical protein
MSPDHIVSVESDSQDYCNKAFTTCETVDENCHRQELKLNCHDLDLELEDSVSKSENVSSDRKSSNMVSISMVPQKDQVLVFSLTGGLENNSPAVINLGKDSSSVNENGCLFANRIRHIVLLLGTLCMMMILSNILILNVTIVCMTSNSMSKESLERENQTAHHSEFQPKFSYSTMEKSNLFAFMAGGALLAVPFAVYLVKVSYNLYFYCVDNRIFDSGIVLLVFQPFQTRGPHFCGCEYYCNLLRKAEKFSKKQRKTSLLRAN